MPAEVNPKSSLEELDDVVSAARAHRREVDAREGQLHIPNHIPAKERVGNVLLSLVLFGYCTFGALHDDIYIPGKRSNGVHMHGVPMWVIYGAMLAAVTNMLSVVVDHYDVRANELNYKRISRFTQVLGWILFILAFVLDVFLYKTGARHLPDTAGFHMNESKFASTPNWVVKRTPALVVLRCSRYGAGSPGCLALASQK